MTMKKRVPPSAHSKPKVAAMCIHNFLFSGIFAAKIPERRRGTPNKDGKNDVIESESESTETKIPQIIRNPPYPEVIVGIDWPATVYCSLMIVARLTTL